MRKLFIIIIFVISFSSYAQEEISPISITAENINHLQSVAKIDFAEPLPMIVAESPSTSLDLSMLTTGWFNLDDFGQVISIPSPNGQIYFIEDGLVFYNEEAALMTEDLQPNISVTTYGDIMAAVYSDGQSLHIRIGTMSFYGGGLWAFDLAISDEPLALWLDCEDNFQFEDCGLYLEMQPLGIDGEAYILFIPPQDMGINDVETIILPYAPSQDPEALVRIGRIPPPYTVTSSLEGIVKLWDLETGEILYEVNNGTGQAATFGAINNPPTHLVWRDNANESLFLLNFETGENHLIAPLNGDYAQWYFLSNDASIILAVNLGFEPNIVAWDVATGEKTILGEYRQCSRPQPDMARLSADGSTLIIGCDTGLDIWRIIED